MPSGPSDGGRPPAQRRRGRRGCAVGAVATAGGAVGDGRGAAGAAGTAGAGGARQRRRRAPPGASRGGRRCVTCGGATIVASTAAGRGCGRWSEPRQRAAGRPSRRAGRAIRAAGRRWARPASAASAASAAPAELAARRPRRPRPVGRAVSPRTSFFGRRATASLTFLTGAATSTAVATPPPLNHSRTDSASPTEMVDWLLVGTLGTPSSLILARIVLGSMPSSLASTLTRMPAFFSAKSVSKNPPGIRRGPAPPGPARQGRRTRSNHTSDRSSTRSPTRHKAADSDNAPAKVSGTERFDRFVPPTPGRPHDSRSSHTSDAAPRLAAGGESGTGRKPRLSSSVTAAIRDAAR